MGARRLVLANVAALGSLLTMNGACQPPPPRPVLVVNSTETDGTVADADPGDGVCEVTPGAGDCTLQAAVDEANASGVQTDLVVPEASYQYADPVITGKVRINWGLPNRWIGVDGLTVAEGGQLLIDGLTMYLGADLRVDGVFVAKHAAIMRFGPALEVGPNGIAALESSSLASATSSVIVNDGHLGLRHVTVVGAEPPPTATITTGPGGATSLWSSVVTWKAAIYSYPEKGDACSGPVTSMGGNVSYDATCGTPAAGDVQGSLVAGTWEPIEIPGPGPYTVLLGYTFSPTSTVGVDRIAPGTNGCGTEVVDDVRRGVRPTDGDGDGVAACDAGAVEKPGVLPGRSTDAGAADAGAHDVWGRSAASRP